MIQTSIALQKLKVKPDVLRFRSVLIDSPAKGSGSGLALELPVDVSDKLHGMDKVEGVVNDRAFRTAVEQSDGAYWLPVSKAMLRNAAAEKGDEIEIAILGPEPDPIPASDLQRELDASPEATENWEELTTLAKRDWLRWIDDTNNQGTRARRIVRAIEQLSEGKRRACCVNVNGFMMCRIQEDGKQLKQPTT